MPLDHMPDGFDARNWPPDNRIEYPMPWGDPFAVDPTGVHSGGNMLDHYLTEMGHLDAIARAMAERAAVLPLGQQAIGLPTFELPITTNEQTEQGEVTLFPKAARAVWLRDLPHASFGSAFAELFGEASGQLPEAVRERPRQEPIGVHYSDGEEGQKTYWDAINNTYTLQNVRRNNQRQYIRGLGSNARYGELSTRWGLPIEYVTLPEDAQFCRDFLAVMGQLGWPESRALPPLRLDPARLEGWDPDGVVAELLRFIEPVDYRQIVTKYRPVRNEQQEQQYSSYLRGVVDQAMHGQSADADESLIIRGYPLRQLNERATLYLCEDGGVRIRTPIGWLPAPVPDGREPHWLLSEDPAYIVSNHRLSERSRAAFFDSQNDMAAYLFTAPEAYPPRERLLDIAGQALGAAPVVDRSEWHEGPYARRALDRTALSQRPRPW